MWLCTLLVATLMVVIVKSRPPWTMILTPSEMCFGERKNPNCPFPCVLSEPLDENKKRIGVCPDDPEIYLQGVCSKTQMFACKHDHNCPEDYKCCSTILEQFKVCKPIKGERKDQNKSIYYQYNWIQKIFPIAYDVDNDDVRVQFDEEELSGSGSGSGSGDDSDLYFYNYYDESNRDDKSFSGYDDGSGNADSIEVSEYYFVDENTTEMEFETSISSSTDDKNFEDNSRGNYDQNKTTNDPNTRIEATKLNQEQLKDDFDEGSGSGDSNENNESGSAEITNDIEDTGSGSGEVDNDKEENYLNIRVRIKEKYYTKDEAELQKVVVEEWKNATKTNEGIVFVEELEKDSDVLSTFNDYEKRKNFTSSDKEIFIFQNTLERVETTKNENSQFDFIGEEEDQNATNMEEHIVFDKELETTTQNATSLSKPTKEGTLIEYNDSSENKDNASFEYNNYEDFFNS